MSAGPKEIIRDDVRAMKAYPVAQADGLVKLDAMENPYGLPQALQREIAEVVSRVAINRYPDPTAPALVRRLRETMGIPAEFDVLLGHSPDRHASHGACVGHFCQTHDDGRRRSFLR